MNKIKLEDIREEILQLMHNNRRLPNAVLLIPYTHIEIDNRIFVGVDDNLTPFYKSNIEAMPVREIQSILGYRVKYSSDVQSTQIASNEFGDQP